MAMFNACPNFRMRSEVEVLITSFWINNDKRTKIPINANEPAIAAVVTVDTVDVVTVEIIIFSSLYIF
jgi:hypothetical protein